MYDENRTLNHLKRECETGLIMPLTTRATKQVTRQLGSVVQQEKDSRMASELSVINLPAPVAKGYKITDNKRSRRFGVGARCLEELKAKAGTRFKIIDVHIYLAEDGLEVTDEDYFNSLEGQTLFVVDGPNAVVTTESDYKFEQLKFNHPLLLAGDVIYEFMKQHPEKFNEMIMDYEKRKQEQQRTSTTMDKAKTDSSLKSEHQEWFTGPEEKYMTKEEVMSRRAQDRVRSYYYKAKDELTRNEFYRQNEKGRHVIDAILEKFRYLLIGCDYFSMMFDRKCEQKHWFLKENDDDETDARLYPIPSKKLKQIIREFTLTHQVLDEWSVSLCNNAGRFYCQGAFSKDTSNCALRHTINPYASREDLILFQVWNLDHQIELSRTIIPSLLANVKELVTEKSKRLCHRHRKPFTDVSVLEYFLEIFSLKNLKLVHIVCHEKVQRSNHSNGRLICQQCPEYIIVRELMNVSCPPSSWEEGA